MILTHKFRRLCATTLALILGGTIAFTAVPAMEAKAEKNGELVIVIDPGHGGDDPGKVGVNGVHEEDVNYEIARAMMNELKKYDGVKVYMTRGENDWNTNTGRAMVAASLRGDFLVSIHNNSGTENSEGAIVYTSVLPLYSTITADMGNNILNNLAALGIKNNGIQTRNSTSYVGEDYYTIMGEGMRAGVPTVLVEHCFLSSAQDSLFVSHADGTLDYAKIEAIGKADAAAVISYFNMQIRTATTGNKVVNLEKGYTVKVLPETTGTGEITWTSTNESIVSVDAEGNATALNSGSAEIIYKYEDGTSGKLSVTVKVPQQIALVGAVDPTFYKTEEGLQAIKYSDVFAQIVYSDGSVVKVTPESVGTVDTTKVGVQDIPITYGLLEGSVRVVYEAESYIPEVTSREPEPETEPQTEPETITVEPTQPESTTAADNGTATFDVMMIVKLATGIVIVVIFGTIIFLLENKITNDHKKNRRRRY